MVNWKDIGSEFTEKLKNEWENKGFSYEQTRDWINVGLNVNDYNFAGWLRNQGYTTGWVLSHGNAEELRQEFQESLRESNSKTLQEWLDGKYTTKEKKKKVKEIIINDITPLKNVEGGKLNLSEYPNLEAIIIWGDCLKSPLTELELGSKSKLVYLDCSVNQLTDLDLSDCSNLQKSSCYSNFLTKIKFSNSAGERLEYLDLSNNNFPKQNLSFLSSLVNLRELWLGKSGMRLNYENDKHVEERINQGIYNRFTGSLESLKKMNRLEKLDISNTDIDSGLEYLPESLSYLECSNKERIQAKVKKLRQELLFSGWRLKAWKEMNPELVTNKPQENLKSELHNKIKTPKGLLEEIEKEENYENYNIEQPEYQEIILQGSRPFSWEAKQKILPSSKLLPTKLYNIQTNQIEKIGNNSNIEKYAVLSYAWGEKSDENGLSLGGKKALAKAIETCKLLGINYLWMDQLCIDQTSTTEKNQEVPKMRQYYSNADITLISINTKGFILVHNDKILVGISEKDKKAWKEMIEENKETFAWITLKKIVNSEWFKRSWTFQEGVLSRQTLFMFDDCLVDGSILAQFWVMTQSSAPGIIGSHYQGLNEDPKIFVTPIGWTYGHDSEKKASLGLSQALGAIKNRDRSIPVDGIYSILGLLPYGEKIKIKYKEPNQIYTKQELEEILLEVMKAAVQEGYIAEPLIWFGSRKAKPYLWWIPETDEKGSAKIWEGINVHCEPGSIEFYQNGVKLNGSQHIAFHSVEVGGTDNSIAIVSTNQMFILEGGEKESLKKVKEGDILVIPNQEKWKTESENHTFAILMPGENNPDCPVNTVGLLSKLGSLEVKEQNLFIDMVNKKIIELDEATSPQLNQEQNQINNQEETTTIAQTQANNNWWKVFTACFSRDK